MEDNLRVVSMVPSWTETLISMGVNVVGRTRFCIHPEGKVEKIPIVGGTKDWKWDEITKLKPDLILLDQEENPKTMTEQKDIPWHATHVQSVQDMPQALMDLGDVLKNKNVQELSKRWEKALKKEYVKAGRDYAHLPGIIEWGKKPEREFKNVLYMIWKDPWMCVSRDTFIGSMLNVFDVQVPQFESKYPKINLEDFSAEDTLVLFSSEPYAFYKKKKQFTDFKYPHAFVNGEYFSWFGIRSLQFLEYE